MGSACSQNAPGSVAPAAGKESVAISSAKKKSSTEQHMEARAKFHKKKNVRVRGEETVVDFASIPDVIKTAEETAFLQAALKKQWLFQSMDEESLALVIIKMTKREYQDGDEIVKQVQFYICLISL